MSKYFVSRQHYYYSGECMVEIACGGLDYANADMLVEKYVGEGEEYADPREAAIAAIEVCKDWRKDDQKDAKVTVVSTGGFSLEGEGMTFAQVKEWAEKAYEKLPKCDYCGELLGKETWQNEESDWTGFTFCREYCAEQAQTVEDETEVE